MAARIKSIFVSFRFGSLSNGDLVGFKNPNQTRYFVVVRVHPCFDFRPFLLGRCSRFIIGCTVDVLLHGLLSDCKADITGLHKIGYGVQPVTLIGNSACSHWPLTIGLQQNAVILSAAGTLA
jgi:hypothetical protein